MPGVEDLIPEHSLRNNGEGISSGTWFFIEACAGKRATLKLLLAALMLCSGCTPSGADTAPKRQPDWRTFRSIPSADHPIESRNSYRPQSNRFLVSDLKYETDSSLAGRLLGAVGLRIAFIDRHNGRWPIYESDNQPIKAIDLYTQPENWGTTSGICRVEKYQVSFSDDGTISSVSVTPRFAIEGPINSAQEFDSDREANLCKSVPASHAPSYFPADGALEAEALANLLVAAIDEAAQDGQLTYRLSCKSAFGGECLPGIRRYLGLLRLDRINETSRINCPYVTGPAEHCFTVKVDEGLIGPFPSYITVRGSTYMNHVKVFEVSIRQSSTIS